MTLELYNDKKLNDLSLRMLDLSARFRRLAKRLGESELDCIHFNDRKALEWVSRLELWAKKCDRELELKLLQHEGSVAAGEYGAD